ncbi:hypothetical protein [Methanobacterium alcaliphilum]|uniref:hypothetical protein n=1 Tax=Methanobacterium alcaliphilum TaxID=392018 RepID=UPI00200A46AD|nr:hypothetical protein [Methanobacterium alcaliphilum]MCK9152050.1 hypothetical protein [Methanobacterium alcaliphilum]
MNIKLVCILIIVLGMISTVNAHGLHVTPENATMIVIADNSTGVPAKKLANDIGLNVSVYNFKSGDDVLHELEHAINNTNKTILVVAYQDTVTDFLSKHPEVSGRIFVSSSDEMDIKNGLILLNSTASKNTNTSSGFLTPFITGIVIGLIGGLAGGVFWMKKKSA